jgi:hypothetical protein
MSDDGPMPELGDGEDGSENWLRTDLIIAQRLDRK